MAKLSKELFVKALKEVLQNEGFYVTERAIKKSMNHTNVLQLKLQEKTSLNALLMLKECTKHI